MLAIYNTLSCIDWSTSGEATSGIKIFFIEKWLKPQKNNIDLVFREIKLEKNKNILIQTQIHETTHKNVSRKC